MCTVHEFSWKLISAGFSIGEFLCSHHRLALIGARHRSAMFRYFRRPRTPEFELNAFWEFNNETKIPVSVIPMYVGVGWLDAVSD